MVKLRKLQELILECGAIQSRLSKTNKTISRKQKQY